MLARLPPESMCMPQVLKKQQQQANAAITTAESNSRQQEQLLEQLEKSKPEGPLPLQQAAQVLATRQPCPPATKGADAGTQGAFSALEPGGNPVYVQQGKQRTSGRQQLNPLSANYVPHKA